MLRIAEPSTKTSACFEIPQYQNSRPQLHKYGMKICETPQYRKISRSKALKKCKTLPYPPLPQDRPLIPNALPWVRLTRDNANARRGWSHFKLTDPL